VVTESAALLHSLDGTSLETLRASRPDAHAALVLALAQLLSTRLRRATSVIRALQD
jgi:hypothetical protein